MEGTKGRAELVGDALTDAGLQADVGGCLGGGRLVAGAKGSGQHDGQDSRRRRRDLEWIGGWTAEVAMELVSLDRPERLHA